MDTGSTALIGFGTMRRFARSSTKLAVPASVRVSDFQVFQLSGDGMSKRPLPVDTLVGRNIRICRLQRGLTQTTLGHHLGVTFQQIQKYEKGANRVGASRLSQISGALGVSLTTLFDGSPAAGRTGPDLSGRDLLANPHALRLVQAFHRIPGAKQRLAVLHLIESIGKAQSRRRSSGRRRRQLH